MHTVEFKQSHGIHLFEEKLFGAEVARHVKEQSAIAKGWLVLDGAALDDTRLLARHLQECLYGIEGTCLGGCLYAYLLRGYR